MPLQVKDNKSLRNLDEELFLNEINSLLNMDIMGLRIKCPQCGKDGIPGPKWVRGLKTKPMYVFHKNGGNKPDACLLDKTQAAHVRKQVILTQDDIKTLLQRGKAYVLFSGGRDSLCALDYIANLADTANQKVVALHVDTTAGFAEVTQYVREICERLSVELEIVKPKEDYFSLAKRWGIPSVNSRWCCRELKIRPITEFLENIRGPKVILDGIRAAESGIRAKYLPVWFHPSFNCLSISAIFNWTDADIEKYVVDRNLPAGLSSELDCSGECWCGAYKTKGDFEKLFKLNPGLFEKLCEVEESNRNGFTFIYEKGERIGLRDFGATLQP
jgi:3'-phosphoadenosine 5'-phosphosulfate sulfotransferase (PAPS reductase)/FAD synthetase